MPDDTSELEVKAEKTTPPEGGTPLSSLRNEIDRLFDDFGAGFWRRPFGQMPGFARTIGSAPAMEVADCDGEFRITAELPGMKPENIDIKLTDGMITIRGEKSEERKEEKESYLLNERRYGSFQRSQPLPAGVDTNAITAGFENGVLTVTLPKTAEARQKERKIEVKAT